MAVARNGRCPEGVTTDFRLDAGLCRIPILTVAGLIEIAALQACRAHRRIM
jgi:hypothetical protein